MFDWTICLALDKRVKERRIDHQLREYGWNVDLFTCGEGKLFPKEMYNHIDVDLGYKPFSQHINHTICFQKITKIAKDQGFNNFLFFEDDVEINKRYEKNYIYQIGNVWSSFLQLNLRWDILYLAGEFFDSLKYLIKDYGDWKLLTADSIRGFAAVVVNKTAYDSILKIDLDYNEGADALVCTRFGRKELIPYCIVPNIFTSYERYSYSECKVVDHSRIQYL